MRSRRSSSKSGLFLMELIIAIVFFAVASAICTQLFVKAHLTSTRSGDLAQAVTIAQNAAESFKADSAAAIAAADVPESFHNEFYDKNGVPVGMQQADGAVYRLVYSYRAEDGLHTALLSVFKLSDTPGEYSEPLVSLTVDSYAADKLTLKGGAGDE